MSKNLARLLPVSSPITVAPAKGIWLQICNTWKVNKVSLSLPLYLLLILIEKFSYFNRFSKTVSYYLFPFLVLIQKVSNSVSFLASLSKFKFQRDYVQCVIKGQSLILFNKAYFFLNLSGEWDTYFIMNLKPIF